MANRSNRPLLRLMGCCFAFAFTSFFSLPASSALVSHSGTFADDGSGGDTFEDDLALSNDAGSTEDILTVVFDLSTAATGTTFEPATWPFVADAGDAAATGFTGEVVTATTLTLTFTDFNPGESFKFTIDLDDNTNVVQGASIAGSTVTATFAITGDVVAVMAGAGGNDAGWSASAVPEPNTLALLAAGLTCLAWGRRSGRQRH